MAIVITEKQFEAQVKDLAKVFGWKYYHTWRSIHSPAGFPDCVMVRPPRLIFAELKSEKGKLSPEQQEWLDILRECQINRDGTSVVTLTDTMVDEGKIPRIYIALPEVYLWRPNDIDGIVKILQ